MEKFTNLEAALHDSHIADSLRVANDADRLDFFVTVLGASVATFTNDVLAIAYNAPNGNHQHPKDALSLIDIFLGQEQLARGYRRGLAARHPLATPRASTQRLNPNASPYLSAVQGQGQQQGQQQALVAMTATATTTPAHPMCRSCGVGHPFGQHVVQVHWCSTCFCKHVDGVHITDKAVIDANRAADEAKQAKRHMRQAPSA